MNKTQKALKLAIEQMQHLIKIYIPSPEWSGTAIQEDCYETIQACKEALAQPAQEPFGYWVEYGEEKDFDMAFRYPDKDDYYPSDIKAVTKLYTNSAPSCQECENLKHDLKGYMEANKALINREWHSLSDDEVKNKLKWFQDNQIFTQQMRTEMEWASIWFNIGVQWAEQALKEKNT